MKTKEQIKEQLIELYYYLSQAMLSDDTRKVDTLRVEIDDLLKEYIRVSNEG